MAADLQERRESTADLAALFSPCPLGARTAPNRLLAQAMETGDGETDGAVSEHALARYETLARGGWGVVVVEATSVTPASVARARGLVLTPQTADSFRRLVAHCKALNPQALLLLQITHSGPESRPEADRVTVSQAPRPGARSLSTHEIEAIAPQHVEAALLAEEIGFDGIDYKLCHAYLGAEILRPANVRTDRWGGSFENRSRYLAEGMAEILARRRSPGFIPRRPF
jgi:2,4-dienoyl-CoA reductase-like NADH-dependent reductase (Old Yellow Enzyme family)